MRRKPPPKQKKKLWVVHTQDLQYNLCGLGETEAQAKRAIWDEIKRTNNNGYGLPPYGTTMSDFFNNYGGSVHHLATGEAESE